MRGETCSLEQGNNPNEERYRKGKRFPAPTTNHQRIAGKIFNNIYNFLKEKACEPFIAPFDVYFPVTPDQEFNFIDTIVQPDISVICDLSKIIKKGCLGAPDLIVEILSPSTQKKDLNDKFRLYEKSGVREYWIVDPGNKFIEVFHLQTEGKESGKYDAGVLIPPADWREEKTTAKSRVLEGFEIDIKDLFNSLH